MRELLRADNGHHILTQHEKASPADIRRKKILAAVTALFGDSGSIGILPDEFGVRVLCREHTGDLTERLNILIGDEDITILQGPRGSAAPAINAALQDANNEADAEIAWRQL